MIGVDLGVIGACQYLLVPQAHAVYRRPATDVGTYGGWRWECADTHPAQYATVGIYAPLAARIAALQ